MIFDCSASMDMVVEGIQLYGGITQGPDESDPYPVYGRGMHFNGETSATLENLNMGPEFSLSIWFRASEFQTLFTVYNEDRGGVLFGIARAIDSGNLTLELIMSPKSETTRYFVS